LDNRPNAEWEEPDCLLCGGRQREEVVQSCDNTACSDDRRYTVVRCPNCELFYTSPRPTPEVIGRYYPDGYGPHQTPSAPARLPWRTRLAMRVGLPVDAWQGLPLHGQGRLLDFGCGGGSFLQRMHQLGWRVTGLDASRAAVERIRNQLGLNALVGSLPRPELADGSFDTVTMWHSLEHVHDPMAVLRDAHRLLEPGGRLLVAVPNIDSIPFRVFGAAWYALDLPRHLTHFTPATLGAMLNRAGFRVRQTQMQRHSRWLRKSAALAQQQGIPLGWKRSLNGKFASRLLTTYAKLTRQTDCMIMIADR
jgi:2-polyprenyl-3-methyl-5-hydroxy-6-metoxy-1,4-benzoquinol methylase